MKKKPGVFNLILLSMVCMSTVTVAGDFVYRPETALSGPIADQLRWTASWEPHITSNVQQAGETSLVGGLSWKPMNHVAVASQFKQVSKGANANSNESRAYITLELNGKTGPFTLAVRNRSEYRMKEGKDNYWRYRARFKIKFPKIGTVAPFLYEEVFYEFGDRDELNGNEAGIGAGLPLGDRIGLVVDLRYRQSKSDGRWGNGDINLLTVLKYSF